MLILRLTGHVFYWIGQVALMAHNENVAPFDGASGSMGHPDIRYRLIKHWLRQIRVYLKSSDGQSTLYWGELMKLRLHSWQWESQQEGAQNWEGLSGFFGEP